MGVLLIWHGEGSSFVWQGGGIHLPIAQGEGSFGEGSFTEMKGGGVLNLKCDGYFASIYTRCMCSLEGVMTVHRLHNVH